MNLNDWIREDVGLLHEKHVGRVVIRWSRLEAVLHDFIWHGLGAEFGLGRLVTARMDANSMVQMLRQIAEHKFSEEHWHRLSVLLDRVDILREDRNLIVHSTWGTNPQGVPVGLSLRPRAATLDQVIGESFPHARMKAIIQTIDKLRIELLILAKDMSVPHTGVPSR